MRWAVSITALAVVALALGACGERAETIPPPPEGAFADALGTIEGSPATTGIGVGWLDEASDVADALGPNASSIYEAAPRLAKRFGFDPRRADQLVAVGGSYAFGLRLDGVGAPRLEQALIRGGAKHRREDGYEFVDAAPYASVPEPLLAEGVRGLGARDAFASDTTVLAISDTARASLIRSGQTLVDNPTYAAAADCLGNVVAVRIIPAKLVRSAELGTDLIALGVEPGGEEVICTVGSSAEVADESADALRAALGPDATDPLTDEPIADVLSSSTVDRDTSRGLELVRARLQLAAGQPPGYVFDAYARGSVAAFLGFGAPDANDVGG